ncbi:MAG: orotidine-5'-phosphate decarboxylase [Patescibacteria group bacterium]
MNSTFREKLETLWAQGKSVCVGLDSELEKIPEHIRQESVFSSLYRFNAAIVDATKDVVCAYKPNSAFYEAHGDRGLAALRATIQHINEVAPNVPVILDAKRADIGNTNAGYEQAAFDYLKADALTVHPYLGKEALAPFLARTDKGIIILCRTSNPGAGEFQDLQVFTGEMDTDPVMGIRPITKPLYQVVAEQVAGKWNNNGNCAVVVGATYPHELKDVRRIVGDMPILIPGIGAQGGDIEKTVKAGKRVDGGGMIINSSRGIIFASSGTDFAEAARRETLKLHETINQFRQ